MSECPHDDAITVGREGWLYCRDCHVWTPDELEQAFVPQTYEYTSEDFG